MEPLHPPFAPGAITIPRTLMRWLDVNYQGGPLTRTMTYITLPVFQANVEWNDYSDIVSAFNYESPNGFTLKAAQGLVDSANYTLCISYRVGNTLTRYIIWEAPGTVFNQDIPFYQGQPIKNNFRFEIWSTSNGNINQTSPVTFYTSVWGDEDYRYGTDTALISNDGQVTDFDVTNDGSSWPTSILVSEAENSAVNGTYTAVGQLTFINGILTGLNKIQAGVSADFYQQCYQLIGANYYLIFAVNGTPNWLLVHTYPPDSFVVNGIYDEFIVDYYNTAGYFNSPDLVPSWKQANTTPSNISMASSGITTYDFALPLMFPANSVSTTN